MYLYKNDKIFFVISRIIALNFHYFLMLTYQLRNSLEILATMMILLSGHFCSDQKESQRFCCSFDFLANSPRNEVTSRNFFTHSSATIFNFVRMVKTGQDNLLLFTIQSPSEVGKSCFTQPFFISFVKSGKFIGKKLHISF